MCLKIFFLREFSSAAPIDGLWYWSAEFELLCWVREILGVFGGLGYRSSECKLLYWVTEIVGVFGELQYRSPEFELML